MTYCIVIHIEILVVRIFAFENVGRLQVAGADAPPRILSFAPGESLRSMVELSHKPPTDD